MIIALDINVLDVFQSLLMYFSPLLLISNSLMINMKPQNQNFVIVNPERRKRHDVSQSRNHPGSSRRSRSGDNPVARSPDDLPVSRTVVMPVHCEEICRETHHHGLI